MQVETEFTSGRHTLSFDSGKRVDLTKEESDEFEDWFNRKIEENDGQT